MSLLHGFLSVMILPIRLFYRVDHISFVASELMWKKPAYQRKVRENVFNRSKAFVEFSLFLAAVNSAENTRGRYCIHATNLSPNTTSEDLSRIFSVPVADILLRPAHPSSEYLASNDQSTSEAWIKHLSDRRAMEDFVGKNSRRTIGQWEISLAVVEEPLSISELCKDFERGNCRHIQPSDTCHYKHILCDEPDECENRKCWLGHSQERLITSDERPVEGKKIHC